jgi:hypothetical protein
MPRRYLADCCRSDAARHEFLQARHAPEYNLNTGRNQSNGWVYQLSPIPVP